MDPTTLSTSRSNDHIASSFSGHVSGHFINHRVEFFHNNILFFKGRAWKHKRNDGLFESTQRSLVSLLCIWSHWVNFCTACTQHKPLVWLQIHHANNKWINRTIVKEIQYKPAAEDNHTTHISLLACAGDSFFFYSCNITPIDAVLWREANWISKPHASLCSLTINNKHTLPNVQTFFKYKRKLWLWSTCISNFLLLTWMKV